MAVTLLSTWLLTAQGKEWRHWGFWGLLLSNIIWIAWGWNERAYALVLLQFGLAALNIYGAVKTND
jgi:hypothetical protein